MVNKATAGCALLLVVLPLLLTRLPAYAVEPAEAERRFRPFCEYRIDALNRFAAAHVICTKRGSAFIGAYTKRSNIFEALVKKAGPAASSYVGILRYTQMQYECVASTPEGARQGPFSFVSETPVTELFLYRNGSWQD